MALRAVRQALRLGAAGHPCVHLALLRLAQRAAQLPATAAAEGAAAEGGSPLVSELVQQGVAEALGGQSLQVRREVAASCGSGLGPSCMARLCFAFALER